MPGNFNRGAVQVELTDDPLVQTTGSTAAGRTLSWLRATVRRGEGRVPDCARRQKKTRTKCEALPLGLLGDRSSSSRLGQVSQSDDKDPNGKRTRVSGRTTVRAMRLLAKRRSRRQERRGGERLRTGRALGKGKKCVWLKGWLAVVVVVVQRWLSCLLRTRFFFCTGLFFVCSVR
jgi:hypothetical protein